MDKINKPLQLLLEYYDLALLEEFKLISMTDNPYYFNLCGSLCDCNDKIKNEVLWTLLNEPERFKRSRKMRKFNLD